MKEMAAPFDCGIVKVMETLEFWSSSELMTGGSGLPTAWTGFEVADDETSPSWFVSVTEYELICTQLPSQHAAAAIASVTAKVQRG